MTINAFNPGLPTVSERAQRLKGVLREAGITSQIGTPCGILASIWKPELSNVQDSTLVTISREDTALAFAAGQALSGGYPAVFMQNSGFGNCVNVMASLVCPFEIPMVLVISLRGTGNDSTAENTAMGKVTALILKQWGVQTKTLAYPDDQLSMDDLDKQCPTAVLIAPEYFGWCP